MNTKCGVFTVSLPYIDFSFQTNKIGIGNEKILAEDGAVSFGGNGTTAAFVLGNLGYPSTLAAPVAVDHWLGKLFLEMAKSYNVHVAPTRASGPSFASIRSWDGERSITRFRGEYDLDDYPKCIRAKGKYCCLHLDGHHERAALHYAKMFKDLGIIVSYDGGTFRGEQTLDLLRYVDIGAVSRLFCHQMGISEGKALDLLRDSGCSVQAVTCESEGLLWREKGGKIRHTPARVVPAELVKDTSGAGDVFHGAYLAALADNSTQSWEDIFRFASDAAAHAVQFLGNEASLPNLADIEAASKLPKSSARPNWVE